MEIPLCISFIYFSKSIKHERLILWLMVMSYS